MRPLLQIALDNTSLDDALDILNSGIDEVVDIIECGTALMCAEGIKAAKKLRDLYPNKKLCIDFKLADGGSVIGGLICSAKPDLMTCIASSTKATLEAVIKKRNEISPKTELQIELFGHYTDIDVKMWKDLGIKHVILHHSTDIEGGWSKEEIEMAKHLNDLGMTVSVTGSIKLKDLELFKDIPIYSIIVGKSLRNASSPKEEAQKWIEAMENIFKD